MKTALIVDNSKLIRCMLQELLIENGLQAVAEAENGLEAIAAYRRHHPDLVLLDIYMPGEESGIDVLHDIRLQNPDASVIIVTDSRDEAVHREALAGGAAAVLCKPVSASDFKTALAQLGPGGGSSVSGAPVKLRALVVDDSSVMRALVRALLTEQGLDVVGEAGDVPEGIDAYERLRPDVVMLDLVMPGGSGADVLKSIRAKNSSAQVVVLTSVSQEKVTAELLELGAGAVLAKPLTPEKFRAALDLARKPALAPAPAVPPAAVAVPAAAAGLVETGTAALKRILVAGGVRGGAALSALFKVPWAETGSWIHEGKPAAGALDGLLEGASDSVAVRMSVKGEMPAVCLFLVDRDTSEKIAELLAPGSLGSGDAESARLVAMEWANILMTNLLNAFAAARGGAILSSPPEFDEAPPAVLAAEAVRSLRLAPEQTFLTRSRFVSEGLGAACDTLLVLPAESVRRLSASAPL
jgi:two-component system chemotaxis response regulator CheY